MHVNKLKTKACISATPNSKPNKGKSVNKGTKCKKNKIPVKLIKLQANPAKIFKRVCPAIILQNNRIAKLKGLKIYKTNSTGTSKKANNNGVPEGKKREKNSNLCVFIQIIFIPIKIERLIAKVTTK